MKYLIIMALFVSCSLFKKNEQKSKKSIVTSSYTEIGKRAAARLITKYKLDKSEDRLTYVSFLTSLITSKIGKQNKNYTIGILDSMESHSFTTSGGFIFLTMGLIKNIENEAQLIGVISHEISHSNRRHLVRSLKISKKTSKNEYSKFADNSYMYLIENRLSANQEVLADQDAINAMYLLGYDIKEYQRYLKLQAFNKRYELSVKYLNKIKLKQQNTLINTERYVKNIK